MKLVDELVPEASDEAAVPGIADVVLCASRIQCKLLLSPSACLSAEARGKKSVASAKSMTGFVKLAAIARLARGSAGTVP